MLSHVMIKMYSEINVNNNMYVLWIQIFKTLD